MIAKPAYGSACNGCGACCRAELCPLGADIFRRVAGPCPALQFKDQRWQCGLVLNPQNFALKQTLVHGAKAMSDAAALLIGAGHGCDACLADEFYDPAISKRLRTASEAVFKSCRKAAHLWEV